MCRPLLRCVLQGLFPRLLRLLHQYLQYLTRHRYLTRLVRLQYPPIPRYQSHLLPLWSTLVPQRHTQRQKLHPTCPFRFT